MSRKILVIEDNKDLAQLLALHLRDLAYNVTIAYDGMTGLTQVSTYPYDLVILDLMLPQLDGLEICRYLRQQLPSLPILILTSKSSELDRVLGLEIGADDYVTKPFSIRELLARIKALFRRLENLRPDQIAITSQIIQSHELVIEVEKHHVSLKGNTINLTSKEFDLLLHFATHPGRVYSRSQLLEQVWGYGYEGYEHTVNSHINRLRAKIENNPTQPHYILTVWGVGYKFVESDR
jgi:DNA-binding response OmpR family regulator